MNNYQINNKFAKVKNFLGVFSCDTLPRNVPSKCGLIVNTDKSSGPGEHWVAIFIENNVGEYFDSFGLPPLVPEILKFLENCCQSWYFNQTQFQGINHSSCGQFAVLYLLVRLNNSTLNNYLEMFSHDLNVNDYIVRNLIKLF